MEGRDIDAVPVGGRTGFRAPHKQMLHDSDVAALGGPMERLNAVSVDCARLHPAPIQKVLHQNDVPSKRCAMEGLEAVTVDEAWFPPRLARCSVTARWP